MSDWNTREEREGGRGSTKRDIFQNWLKTWIYRFKRPSESQAGDIKRYHLKFNKVKLLKTKDKDKILKEVREKQRLFQRNFN